MNADAAEQMNTRSIMIVPITETENVEGLLEMFSPERNYFSEHHMRQLQPLVNVLAEAIKEESKIYGESGQVGSGQVGSGQVAVAAATASETAEVEKPAATQAATYSQHGNRSRVVAVALVLAALLVVIVADVWFTSRERIKSANNGSSLDWRTELHIARPLRNKRTRRGGNCEAGNWFRSSTDKPERGRDL